MPLYEYSCPEHGRFEARRSMAERKTAVCTQCRNICPKVMSACNWTFGWRTSDRSINEKWTPRDELVRNI